MNPVRAPGVGQATAFVTTETATEFAGVHNMYGLLDGRDGMLPRGCRRQSLTDEDDPALGARRPEWRDLHPEDDWFRFLRFLFAGR